MRSASKIASSKRVRRFIFIGSFLAFLMFCYAKTDIRYFTTKMSKYENILSAKVQPKNGENIFFIDSGESSIEFMLEARIACAIESAALTNPQSNVFFLFSSLKRLNALKSSPELDAILSYQNVFVNYLEIHEISAGSPMEKFINSDKLTKSKFKAVHTSDVLRLLLLWKFGGTYLDTDMIVRKRLNIKNFACRQSETEVNNAFLNFNGLQGQKLAKKFIKDVVDNFNGDYFVSNGPVAITRVVKKLCRTEDMTEIMNMKFCENFNVLDLPLCYEIGYYEWKKFFDDNAAVEVYERVSQSLVVHFWHKESQTTKARVDGGAAYVILAKKFCPKVIASCGEYF